MEIAPLPQGFGARVTGLDPRVASPEEIAALRKAFDTRHLLVFEGCGTLTGGQQAEVAGWFGPVGANGDAAGNPWTTLDNENDTGAMELPFHCDIAFCPHPFEGLCLHPLALPEGGTSTTFVSNARGWEAIGPDIRALLHDRKVRHAFQDVHLIPEWGDVATWHPARRLHARTGEPMLFVTENHVREIEGMSAAESAPILKRIFAAIYAPDQRYEHHWRAGDLLVWDNLAIQHARTGKADPAAGRRIMQRVALGQHGVREQMGQLRAGY